MTSAPGICFLIIGLPRSGTSSISQLLENLGVYFGDPSHFLDTTQNTHNPIFYELKWANDFNDAVINKLKPAKTRVSDQLPIEEDFNRPEIAAFRQPLEQRIADEFGDHAMVGIKDPRISSTYPLWQSVLTGMGYTVKTILAIRTASAILKSNLKLTPLPLNSWRRWYVRHLLGMTYFTRKVSPCRFDYDQLMRDPLGYGKEKAAELGLAMPDPAAATRHISPGLYHHQPDNTGTGDQWVDQIDAAFRSGRLEPDEYLRYRRAALLFTEELWEFDTYIKVRQAHEATQMRAGTASPNDQVPQQPNTQQWLQDYQRLQALLRQGGQFDVEPRPDGGMNIRRVSKS
ncbi:MAG TPA: hypothetical protein VGG44_01820 [Tepidisphaeraceae bacterium]|jgi:hypothetical protein